MSMRAPAPFAPACGVLALALVATSTPRPASAQSPADVEAARAYFVEAARLGKEGRWKEARELYAHSLQLKPAPLTHYSLGVARRETGQLAAALSSFRAFLAEPPTTATAPFTAPARAAITALEGTVARVTVTVEPRPVDGLTLVSDGEPVPLTSTRAREIDPGLHELVARAPGFHPATTRVNIPEGGAAAVTITITTGIIIVGARAVPKPAGGLPPTAEAPSPLQPPPEPGPPSRTPAIVLMSLGGAFFGAGLATGLVGVRQASHATTRDGADARSARAKGIAGDVIGGTGLVAAGVGLVLFLTQGRAQPGAAIPAISGSGNGLEVRF
jgi:hypothetical protein